MHERNKKKNTLAYDSKRTIRRWRWIHQYNVCYCNKRFNNQVNTQVAFITVRKKPFDNETQVLALMLYSLQARLILFPES